MWAPLREAVPSFAEHWRAYTEQPGYNPIDPDFNVIEFKSHLADVVGANPEALGPLFAVMERHSPGADDSLDRTISILETLTKAAEEHGVDLRRLAGLLPGPVTRYAWREALAWTHPECDWDDVRGLVPHWPPPVPVGRVRVTALRPPVPEQSAFDVEGELLGGTIRPGLFVWKRISSCCHEGREIAAVEPLASSPGSLLQMLLTMRYHDSESEDPNTRPYIAEGWYEPGEVVEIIEALPPEEGTHEPDAAPESGSASASRPAI